MVNPHNNEHAPGLKDVIAGETALGLVDGEEGRLHYAGFPIGELVSRGTYARVAELLWTGEWSDEAALACAPVSGRLIEVLRLMPEGTSPMDALRTAVSV